MFMIHRNLFKKYEFGLEGLDIEFKCIRDETRSRQLENFKKEYAHFLLQSRAIYESVQHTF
jgi:hypothetical protein